MKKLLALFLIALPTYALEPFSVVNPDENTKVEVVLNTPAKDFALNLDVVKGSGDFELILCDKDGKELKRAQVMQNGECSFGEVDKGKYFIKFKNRAPIIEKKPQDKAAPYIMELPYVRKK